MIAGNNGILTRAGEARDLTAKKEIEERIKLAYMAAISNGLGEVTKNGFEEELEKEFGKDLDVSESLKVTIDGKTYNKDGTEIEPLPSTAATTPYYPNDDFTKLSGTDLNTGLVIKDILNNEYVWVEVPRTTTVYKTAGLEITQFTDDEYESIEDDLYTYVEPYINGSDFYDTYYSTATTGLTSTRYTTLHNKMLKSIYQNGGFWIGRYEAGVDENRTRRTAITTELPKSKPNLYPFTFVYCSEGQKLADNLKVALNLSENKECSLPFGIQWYLILKHIETKGGATQAQLKTDSTDIGNYYNSTFSLTQGKYSVCNASFDFKSWYNYNENEFTDIVENSVKKAQSSNNNAILLTTGASEATNLKNIYDIAGNVWEWTLEYSAATNLPCCCRGGYSIADGSNTQANFGSGGTTTMDRSSYRF